MLMLVTFGQGEPGRRPGPSAPIRLACTWGMESTCRRFRLDYEPVAIAAAHAEPVSDRR